ncbi:sialate O-acetylesterase [Shimia sp.]|uniref:sialate O-acetylesterase n=1 Tax=Shimia sp. TaxID=1954381 RepID=UPI003BAC05EF
MAEFQYRINGGAWQTVVAELPYTIAAGKLDAVEVRAIGDEMSASSYVPPVAIPQPENGLEISSGLFTVTEANLVSQDHISGSNSIATSGSRSMGEGGSSGVNFNIAGVTDDNVWISCITRKNDEFAGTSFRARLLSPLDDPGQTANRNRSGNQVFKFDGAAGLSRFGLVASSTYGDLDYAQVVEMDDVLAMPCDVYIAAGQSNMAATTNGLGVDFSLDAWSDPRLLYASGAANQSYGVSIGSIEALRAPLQAAGETEGNVVSTSFSSGVSPAVSFGKTILHSTEEGRAVCIIMAAVSGTTLIGAGQQWAQGGIAYSHAEAVIAAAMANLPSGSEIKGVMWAQGESDARSDLTAYPAAWAAMRASLEAEWQSNGWSVGQVPWVIGTTPPDSTLENAAALTEMQHTMAPGGTNGQPRVAVVDRIPGIEADGYHATAASNRDLGYKMASAIWGL